MKGPERLAHWVKPVLVCEATYTEWTNDKRLRHPVFVKIRKDVKPKDITPPTYFFCVPAAGPSPGCAPNRWFSSQMNSMISWSGMKTWLCRTVHGLV